MKSPATRNLVQAGTLQVIGAIYDVGTGKIAWLPTTKVDEILAQVEASPDKETEPMAPE